MNNLRRSEEDAADRVRIGNGPDEIRLSKVRSARKALQASHYDSDEILSETASRICTEMESVDGKDASDAGS